MTTAQKKLVRSKSGLRIVTVGHEELSPFHLDEPPWTPDRETADCWRCRSKFDFITRRHHCRRCGRVYCSSCCSRRLPLQRMCFVDPVRICHDCSPATLRENDFYDRHLRLLLAGAPFLVTVVPDAGAALPHCCRLSPDHRILEMENVQSKECIEIPLASICTYRILRPNSPGMTNSTRSPSTSDGGLSGVMIGYRPHGVAPGAGEEQQDTTTELAQTLLHLGLSPAPEAAAQGALWIVALNKAFRMIHSPDVSPE
ncbi:zinc finger FYVE domain-containing protein 21-like [Rhipicephalus microplus]|uniref:zinc finger FYVE domain-containing protein 21-like n=1 Tax=Rhipicephalus microplus TaxID=6941 RepID=UPI003F6C1176